ncbi:YqaJ viral recombinase family protein [Pseudomonas aeruginosa]|uniref:YqaJ viral recombinase family protein n=1 Tax=Pseudomonas aeruginosa TaxID=287 RepID=UPI000F83B909|nr:YqaJ viral recombinase family protein [Pseudomonas aeruginosa]ELK4745506.1 YqaJ viral recombinase family protein [Pseudomonas aeruginosa]MDY1135984.1 YqaJ viral recombinase family protein [Pseudomonas aeruginosa]RTR81082.1 exonuclease [Pseudomonas aeruginosa]RTS27180.1 exonuclease [Pseudomonas aeruginosa]
MQIFKDLEQGSQEWLDARLGIATCSELDVLMVNGKGQAGFGVGAFTYMDRLIGERITGAEAEPWRGNGSSARGHKLEPVVRDLYCLRTDTEPDQIQQAGIILNHGIGYSPDGLVGDNGLIEVKTKVPEKLVSVILDDKVPAEHAAQCMGGLWVSEREWIDFLGYWPGMPLCMVRVHRDEAYIRKLSERVKTFYELLEERMEKVLGVAA